MTRILHSLGLAGFSFFLLCGFGEQHSSVESKASVETKKLRLQFRVKPNAGMTVTKEGPWSLTLTNTKGLKLETKDGSFQTKEFIETLPGFEVVTEAVDQQSGQVNFVLKAFVCSEDKKHCYPQQHKGTLDWKS